MMGNKIIAVIAGAAFCLFEFSCASSWVGARNATGKIQKKDPSEIEVHGKKPAVISVVKKDGKVIDFGKKNPGWIDPATDSVVGKSLQEFDIDKDNIKVVGRDEKGNLIRIQTADGREFAVISSTEVEEKVHFSATAPITIPLSEVQQVWIAKESGGPSTVGIILAVLGVAAVVAVIGMIAALNKLENMESCPFIYSWDGEEYVLDAEPFGAAASEGLKRTDWAEMTNLREADGKYRVRLANEQDETQYMDELKLVVVDHSPGIIVAPDLAGRVHTFSDPQPPIAAVDQAGRDILAFVAKNDPSFWLSPLEDRGPDGDGDFRDELTFEFPKPEGAKRAKLLTNLWTTQWGALSTRKFLELFGSSLPEQYEDIDRHGPTYFRLMNWIASEELFALKVWVETPGGWKVRGMITEGSPAITKDKAYVLDVSDAPGDVLRIKLRPPVNFWMVNYLGVDYGEDQPVHITEIAAESAVDHTGRDVRAELSATDSTYHVSPNPGERTELVFAAPPLREGLERTVLVKAAGFYRAHLHAKGEPQTELIGRFLGEPGFAARYSFREYLKWVASIEATHAEEKR